MKDKSTKGLPGNLTYLIFPFHLGGNWTDMSEGLSEEKFISRVDGIISKDATLWERKKTTIENNVLYEYIKPNTNSATTPFLAYQLRQRVPRSGENANHLQMVMNLWNKLEAELEVKELGKSFRLSFGRERSNWNGPSLLISPVTGVGMLVLSVNPLVNHLPAEELILFNYTLRKIDGSQKLHWPEPVKTRLTPGVASRRVADLKAAKEILEVKDTDFHGFSMSFNLIKVVEMLLTGLPSPVFFEKGRAHVFTYYRFQRETLELSSVDKQAMILLTRCVNTKYNIPVEDFDRSSAFMATFRNIYIGSSIEGGCICTVEQLSNSVSANEANAFIRGFAAGVLQTRYLWLYFMALFQRYEVLQMVHGLSALDLHDTTASQREAFNREYRNFCSAKLKGLFRNVSSFSQHNQFYKFLTDNMGIDELYQEVEGKIQIVDSYLQMRNNELQTERNELLKERNERNEERNHRLNRLSLWLSVFFAVATFSQAAESMYHICTDKGWTQVYFGAGTLLFYAVSIVLIYFLAIRKKSK